MSWITNTPVTFSTVTATTNVSGQVVNISGAISGSSVNISGNVVYTNRGTSVYSTTYTSCTNGSGGTTLASGNTTFVKLRAVSGNGVMSIGRGSGSTVGTMPNSGIGMDLWHSDGWVDVPVANPNQIAVWAFTSGQNISWIGIAP
jgi:hypothetical protein